MTRPNQTKLVDHDVEATDLRLNWRIRNNRHRVTIFGTAAGNECSRNPETCWLTERKADL